MKKRLILVGLIASAMVFLNGCAEKTKDIEKEELSKHFKINGLVILNNDGTIKLGSSEDKIVIPECPNKSLFNKMSLGTTTESILNNNEKNSSNFVGFVLENTICIETLKDNQGKALVIYTEYKEIK